VIISMVFDARAPLRAPKVASEADGRAPAHSAELDAAPAKATLRAPTAALDGSARRAAASA